MVTPQDCSWGILCQYDLQVAYFHIPIHPAYRRYLRFQVNRQHYQFKVLTFGVTIAPLAVVAANLRRGTCMFSPI